MNNMNFSRQISNHRAFTLAEVLITLGVIGIVATMTIPNLVQNYKKREYSTRLKKFYSMMSQAIKLSEVDNGPSSQWVIPFRIKDDDGNVDWDAGFEMGLNFFNTYFKPYMNIVGAEENVEISEGLAFNNSKKNLRVSLNDGSIFYFTVGNCVDIDYDVNGLKSPNEAGRDIYKFVFCSNAEDSISNTFSKKENQNFSVYCSGITNRDQALRACSKESYRCPCLLQYDNFEFKDDYPYKL